MPEFAWLAGLIEGEGCFTLGQGKYLRFSLSLTDLDVLEMALSISGIGHINGPYTRKSGTKQYWIWQSQKNEDVRTLIGHIYDYMGSRRKAQINECLMAQGGN